MNLLSNLVYVFILISLAFSQQVENMSKYSRLSIFRARNFGFEPLKPDKPRFYQKIQRERKKQEKMREEEESRRRKILNDHLMPLTRGNSFMRDFYSGRY